MFEIYSFNSYILLLLDDKKLAAVLKKLQLGTINGIEEVNIFKNNGEVIHIKNPKSMIYIIVYFFCLTNYLPVYLHSIVQASTPSNTFVIGGNIEIKQLTELIPSILDQVGPETLDRLRRLASENGAPLQSTEEDDDEDVPELVENFEEAAAK